MGRMREIQRNSQAIFKPRGAFFSNCESESNFIKKVRENFTTTIQNVNSNSVRI